MATPSNVHRVLTPTISPDQSIYEESSTSKARLGTRIQVGERVFYYARLSTSANVSAGDVLCAPQLIASHQSGILSIKTNAATNATVVSISVGTAVTLDQYAEGYLISCATASAGCGQTYRIKTHPAVATNASGNFTLYDALVGSMETGAASLVPCIFSAVKVGSEALDLPVGVAPIAVTTGNYFWLQTWGPGAAKHEGTTVAAGALRVGTLGGVDMCFTTGTLGSTGSALPDFSYQIGKNFHLAATATQTNPVFLTILP